MDLQSRQQLFISYASVDRARVTEINAQLNAAGFDSWIDTSGIAGGAAYGAEIAGALRESAAVLVMCSPASLASKNVRQEIMLAWRYDVPLVPLLLEPVTFEDDIAYWLEGAAQRVDVSEGAVDQWLPVLKRTLRRAGIEIEKISRDSGTATAADQESDARRRLIGREREMQEVQALLANSRWVSLIGTGGGGKTTLALEIAGRAAPRYRDGMRVVELANERLAASVLPRLAREFGVSETPGKDLIDSITDALGDAEMLIVLDNLEQIADVGPVLELILDHLPQVTLLTTSRTPTKSTREWSYAVPPLATPSPEQWHDPALLMTSPTVALFVERAREAKPDFTLTEGNSRAVAEICVRLEGLPLAIELAAARVRLLPPAAIVSRLGSRLNLLTRGSSTSDARHQTLRDTIAWSHDLLSPEAQLIFRRASIFTGGANAGALVSAALLSDLALESATDAINDLLDHSLFRSQSGPEENVRYAMLESIREFAFEMLVESGEQDAMSEAHAVAMEKLVSADGEFLRNPRPGPAIQRLAADDANLREALNWRFNREANWQDSAVAMVMTLRHYWLFRGQLTEATTRLWQTLERVADDDKVTRASILTALAQLSLMRGSLTDARELHQKSLGLWRVMADEGGEASSLLYLGLVALYGGDLDLAAEQLQKCLEIRQRLGDQKGSAEAFHELGKISIYGGDYAHADNEIGKAIQLYRSVGNANEALSIALDDFGSAAMMRGEFELAIARQQEAMTLFRAVGNEYNRALCQVNHGRALQLSGRSGEAIVQFEAAIEQLQDSAQAIDLSLAWYGLGLIALEQGDVERARVLLTDSLRIEKSAGEPWHIAERLEALAAADVDHDSGRGASLLGVSAKLRNDSGMPMPPVEQSSHEATVSELRRRLGEERFQQAFAAGELMQLEEAYALVPELNEPA